LVARFQRLETADIYRPDQWHDYFITVGGASAALTGLVFVAMSLNPGLIAQDQTHRRRAVGTIAGFSAIFIICGLAVMGGQDHRAVGLEWLVVSAAAAAVYVYGYIQAIRRGSSSVGLRSRRLIGGTALHGVEITGASLLLGGYIAGLYLAAISMVALLAYMISGAWLLIMGVSDQRPKGRDAQ
jgi:hypothetical protein